MPIMGLRTELKVDRIKPPQNALTFLAESSVEKSAETIIQLISHS